MATDRHFEIYNYLNNFRTIGPILVKFGTKLRLDAIQVTLESKIKPKKAADEKLKFTINKLNNKKPVRPICTKFGM